MKTLKGIFVAAMTLLWWQPVMAQDVIQSEALASADMTKGKRAFLRCRSCHTLAEGERNKVGPNLYGLFGQPVGIRDDFKYSQAVQSADFIWTPDKLNEWLIKPKEFLPGTIMNFNGLPKEADRINLIAYLIAETGGSIEDIAGAVDGAEAEDMSEDASSAIDDMSESMPDATEPAAEMPATE